MVLEVEVDEEALFYPIVIKDNWKKGGGNALPIEKEELYELFEKMLPHMEFNRIYQIIDKRLKEIHQLNIENK